MKRIFSIVYLTVGLTTLGMAQQKKPNIILILADDLGYSDLGAYGAEIATPNLDRLASEGLRLQEFYNNSICAPTRASLLTGQYQHKAGVGYFSNDLGLPAYQGYINQESLTIAEVLKENGYTTITSGKWHVSGKGTSLPWQRGFDLVFPKDEKSSDSGAPTFRDGKTDSLGYPLSASFSTNLINQHALTFLDQVKDDKKPFFLYLAHTAPHWPLVALPEDIAKYKGKYDRGWEVIRQERFVRQKQLGLIPSDTKLSVRDEDIYDWDRLSYDQRQLWAKKMEVYAAMVDRLDQSIGQLIQKLKDNGQLDNTLIVFLSDNGAPAEDLVKWHHGARINTGTVGTLGSYESQSKNWSYASNTPYKAFKDYTYEGGINTAFIAWFPNRIQANTIKHGVGHIIDLAPTFYELAGAKYPKTYKGVTPNPLKGKSLLPVLFDEKSQIERPEGLFWERAGNRAARIGKWKLVSTWPSYKWELYNLETDPTEIKDVAGQNHDVVSQLSQAYFRWAKENDVVDFAELEEREPASMKEFRKSKLQEIAAPAVRF
ncbi:arylsulfatase [Sphingobacterium sp. SRCM116780]|uniref:arylsulfatase n=1 Tax=Sphingobacterium sp. SRCM116780 TaxID=2907623 RepID=UPI001F1D2759|nr:arylsulfatase [Sphingobacterium sp. SRCM116780]UIR57615.1 arylsulfatase [Sphingobacterium sp. SRCM116780]